MGIFSLPAEPTRCSDLLLWFAPPPWSPLRLTLPCSSELATLVLATLVLATLVLLVPPSLPLPLPPPPTPPPLLSASLLPASTLPTSPSPAIATTGVIGGYSSLGGYYGKREAEADPLILGNLGAGYSGLGFGHAGIDARPAAGLAQNFYPGAARVIAAPVIATTGVI